MDNDNFQATSSPEGSPAGCQLLDKTKGKK